MRRSVATNDGERNDDDSGTNASATHVRSAMESWMTSHTALIASPRVLLRRHTAPTVRDGTGFENDFTAKPCPEPNGPRVASSGNNVTPSPAATICRNVSRLVAR